MLKVARLIRETKMSYSMFEFSQILRQESHVNVPSIERTILSVIRESQGWYPGIFDWFSQIFIPGLKNGSRDILVYTVNNDSAGVALLKNQIEEKKICTFFVKNQYRNNGIGKSLFGKCLKILGTNKPMITVPGERLYQFSNIFKYYDLKLEQVVENYYRNLSTEYVFNGNLATKTGSNYESSIPRYSQFLQIKNNILSHTV